jgi:hypothetical protein
LKEFISEKTARLIGHYDERDKLKDKKTNDLLREKDDIDNKRIEKEREMDRL